MRTASVDLGLETLRLEQDGRVLTAYYSNLPSNYVTGALLHDLDLLTRGVDDDETIGAVVIASDVEGHFLNHVDPNPKPWIDGRRLQTDLTEA